MSDTNTTTVLGENINPSSDDSQNTTQDTTNVADQAIEENYLDSIVGEGKKYKSIEEAAKSLAKKAAHADTFIETLKTEKRTLEDQLASAKKVDDILAALKQDTVSTETVIESTVTEQQPQDIREVVSNLLQEKENETKKDKEVAKIKTNQTKTWELLAKEFDGIDNAKLKVRQYIDNDSTKANIINQLGSYQPEELVKFLKSQKSESFNPTTTPTKRSVTEFDDSISLGLTWSKAQKVKKENPRLYNSHKFKQMIHEAASKDPNFLNK